MSLNSHSIRSGQNIVVKVSEYNALFRTNTVSSADSWRFEEMGWNCDRAGRPVGFSIFRGVLSIDNISGSRPLDLGWGRLSFSCGEGWFLDVTSYSFQRFSSTATVTVPKGALSLASGEPMQWSNPASGYWTFPDHPFRSGTYHAFEAGVYTVAGGDEWGRIILEDFTVE